MTLGTVLITGGSGMLARTLLSRWTDSARVVAANRERLDVTRLDSVEAALDAERPAIVVHCAAHTKVDACESEVERAFAINATGSTNVAIACHRRGIRLVAISTDYVFPGDAARPYHEWDTPGPRTVYGASKCAGEDAIRAHCPDHLIARVAWLYGSGGPSFIHTMAKLGAQEGPPLKVVADQIGNPTSTDVVADALRMLIAGRVAGTCHVTCEGEATWFDVARELFRLRSLRRELTPCATAEYPRPAPRPANSRLEKRFLRAQGFPALPDWKIALADFLTRHPHL